MNYRPTEQEFNEDGIRSIRITLGSSTVQRKKQEWKKFVEGIGTPPKIWGAHQGIVISAGGMRYLTCAWVGIRMLRKAGCKLPIELWHQRGEITDEVRSALEPLGVECRDVSSIGGTGIDSYQIKAFSILHSSFKEVLYLDSDNVCTRDPA